MTDERIMNSTNFDYIYFNHEEDIIFKGGCMLHPLTFKKYLAFMGKLAYINDDEKLDIVSELLAATIILRKDTTWKFTYVTNTKDRSLNSYTFVSPIFEPFRKGELNVVNFSFNYPEKSYNIDNVKLDSNGEFILHSKEKIFNVSLETIKTLKGCPENKEDYLPFIKGVVARGLSIEIDFIEEHGDKIHSIVKFILGIKLE